MKFSRVVRAFILSCAFRYAICHMVLFLHNLNGWRKLEDHGTPTKAYPKDLTLYEVLVVVIQMLETVDQLGL